MKPKSMKDQIDLSKMESVVVEGDFTRLRRHWCSPTEEFWQGLYDQVPVERYWARASRGDGLAGYEKLYRKHLSPGARVLEAGCGVGQVVLALRYEGYDAWGIDFQAKTIVILKERFPDVSFDRADIRSLPQRFLRSGIDRSLGALLPRRFFGHMVMFVAEKA